MKNTPGPLGVKPCYGMSRKVSSSSFDLRLSTSYFDNLF
jgi:hypothetical protein